MYLFDKLTSVQGLAVVSENLNEITDSSTEFKLQKTVNFNHFTDLEIDLNAEFRIPIYDYDSQMKQLTLEISKLNTELVNLPNRGEIYIDSDDNRVLCLEQCVVLFSKF